MLSPSSPFFVTFCQKNGLLRNCKNRKKKSSFMWNHGYFFVVCTEIDQKENKINIFFVIPLFFGDFVVLALCSTDIIRFW